MVSDASPSTTPDVSFRQWLEEALDFYQKLKFFETEEAGLIDRLEQTLTEGKALTDFDPKNPVYDLALLSYDPGRAIMENSVLGKLLAPGNRVFIQSLQQLAHISRGVFKPEKISETWETTTGPVTIKYTHRGSERQLIAPADEGRIDPVVLLQLNLALFRSPLQFELVSYNSPDGQEMFFVTALNRQERFLIEHQRRVPFVIYSLPRTIVPLGVLCPHPDFSEPVEYVGTVNEFLDRCVGKLEFELKGNELTGTLVYEGLDHQESLEFQGTRDPDTQKVSGKVSGLVCTPARGDEDFVGTFQGQLDHNGRVMSGFWRGWVADLGDEEPEDKSLLNIGEWAVLCAPGLARKEPHMDRVRKWLEEVWDARTPEAYPWTL